MRRYNWGVETRLSASEAPAAVSVAALLGMWEAQAGRTLGG